MIRKEELNLTTEWDKTFPRSEKVDHSKVTFVNRSRWPRTCISRRLRKAGSRRLP